MTTGRIEIGWKRAEDIVAGDVVRTADGKGWFRVRRVHINTALSREWEHTVELWYRDGAMVPEIRAARLDLIETQFVVDVAVPVVADTTALDGTS